MVEQDNSLSRRQILKRTGATATAAGISGLAGCTNSGGGGGDDTVTVGIIAGMSGPYASSGERIIAANELVFERVNENGGINGTTIETVTGDTKGNPEDGVQAARELVNEENVDFLKGGTTSSVGVAIQSIMGELEVPFMFEAVSNEFIGPNCNKWSYDSAYTAEIQTNAIFPYLIDEAGSESIYFITADYSWGQSSYGYYEQRIPELGGEVAGNSYAQLGSSDFSNQISQALDSDADTIALTLFGQDAIKCINQLDQFGAFDEMENIVGVANSLTIDEAVGDLITEMYMGAIYYWNLGVESNQKFVEAYEERRDEKPTVTAALEYGSAGSLVDVMRQEGTSREAMAQGLEGFSSEAFKGGQHIWRDCDHQLLSDFFLMKGKPESERDDPQDYMEVVNRGKAEEISGPCSEECGLPGWS